MIAETIFYAVTIGMIPAFIWLWFWLHEDSEHPEPRMMIAIAFVAGMIAAPLALLVQIALQQYLGDSSFLFMGTIINYYVIAWVVAEELLKFAASYFALKNKRIFDEPVDAMIYLITTALGFVAVENTLYALQTITNTGIIDGFINGISRFLGPSLLHIVTSGMLGLSISLSFYLHGRAKRLYIYAGLFTAILLHAFYNFFIIVDTPQLTTIAFTLVWVLAVALVALFEIVKKIKKN
jgi:protease PrsW